MLKEETVQSPAKGVYTRTRKTGIPVIGDASWGTHFCQFYQTKEDLLDILVPYFKAGLESNESCVWVTSGPLSVEEAKEAMRRAVPDFDGYVERGQIEIVPHTEWHLKGGAFNLQRVLNGWVEKLNQALAKGYDGMRVTGNTAWLEKRDWKNFVDYEQEINDVIGKYRMIAICTYLLDKCGASEVIDVVRNHQFVVIKREGKWELVESSEMKRARETLQKGEEKFRNIFEMATDCMIFLDKSGRIIDVNEMAVKVFGGSREELLGRHIARVMVGLVSPRNIPMVINAFLEGIAGKKPHIEVSLKNKKGQVIHLDCSNSLLKIDDKSYGLLVIARDISERKKAEKIIRESQEKFERLFMSNPEATVFSDLNDRVLDANPRFSELFGYSPNEAKGQLLDDLIVPDDLKEEAKRLTGITEGYVYHDTVRKRKDGSLIPVSISSASLKCEDQHLGNVVQYKDISERKKVEERIRESEEKYRNLFENARDLILTVDLEGNITSANSTLLEYGYSKSDLLGKSLFNIFPKEYFQRFRDFFQNFTKGKPVEGEFKIKSKAKQGYSIVEYRGNPIIQNNKIVGVQVIVRDITQRKEMEEKLRQYSENLEELVHKRTEELLESEGRYSVLVEEASDAVTILQDGKVVFANKKAAGVIGYSRDELEGLPLEKLVDEKYLSLSKEMHERNLRGDVLIAFEVEWRAKNGERIPFEVSGARINYRGRPAVLRVARDIRERKRMEETRQRLEKMATIGELATMVGHDLRNPLQSIENAAYYLNNELPHLSPSAPNHNTAIEMLQAIHDSIKYADKIIRDLQDFSSIKKPILRKTEINVTIRETVSHVKIPENVELRTDFSYVPEILVDEDQMKRVFLNLTTNAIQAMEKGGTLAVSTKQIGDFIEVSFRDTGIGILKENMSNLFKPLFTTKARGMGMGLPICKKFVESHGGTIQVESEVDKGTTFTVKLPVQQKTEVKTIDSE